MSASISASIRATHGRAPRATYPRRAAARSAAALAQPRARARMPADACSAATSAGQDSGAVGVGLGEVERGAVGRPGRVDVAGALREPPEQPVAREREPQRRAEHRPLVDLARGDARVPGVEGDLGAQHPPRRRRGVEQRGHRTVGERGEHAVRALVVAVGVRDQRLDGRQHGEPAAVRRSRAGPRGRSAGGPRPRGPARGRPAPPPRARGTPGRSRCRRSGGRSWPPRAPPPRPRRGARSAVPPRPGRGARAARWW